MEFTFDYCSKAKLERIESIVVCNHNQNEFHANYLRYFAKLKNLYIDKSSFQKFSAKLPKIDSLSVSLSVKVLTLEIIFVLLSSSLISPEHNSDQSEAISFPNYNQFN